jgi:tRNA(fMet)-specific endonuclease VapC
VIYLLDTNILIYLIKNHPPVIAERVNALPETALLATSFITWAALLKGAERSTRKPEVLRRLDALTRQVTVLYPSGPAICQHYAEQFTRLKGAGTPIGANDLWIACHALAERATLVTHNTRDFQRVDGLRIEDWVGAAGESG